MGTISSWLDERGAGLLLHPSSLPGRHGIGTLGASARAFIDFLARSKLRYWQILPLGPTSYGNSPYSTSSVFAGDPLLIDLEDLQRFGLLQPDELGPLHELSAERIEFDTLRRIHRPLLRLAARRFQDKELAYLADYGLYDEFLRTEALWLEPYALFMALKERHQGAAWQHWAEPYKNYAQAAEGKHEASIETARETHRFSQYLFWGQWQRLRRHASERGVEIIGDLPIYAAGDSADVWAESENFQLDEAGHALAMAGVPPDYFSATGQLWGNPIYDWDELARQGYDWWLRRLAHNFRQCDIVRLDHFRAFYDYWSVPRGAEDARQGAWCEGPQHDFFNALSAALPEARIIAEDLGEISPGVRQFLAELGFPGMAILQFAFDGSDSRNLFLPHNLDPNSVIYTGTHDNNTSLGWYEQLPGNVQDQIRRYFRVSGEDIAWDLIRAAFRAVSRLAIIPAQDVLMLDSDHRMNVPGVADGNWTWRMTEEQFEELKGSSDYFRELTWLYGR